MFKWLFVFSGVLAMAATAMVFSSIYCPKVNVMELPFGSLSERDYSTIRIGDVVQAEGIAKRVLRDVFGRSRMTLKQQHSRLSVNCLVVAFKPAAGIEQNGILIVRGVVELKTDTLLGLTDCVVISP